MKRRIEIYENTEYGKGTRIFCSEVEIHKNSILERDIAGFILKMEKDEQIKLNSILVSKYIVSNKKGLNSLEELFDYALHPEHFKPSIQSMRLGGV